MNGQYGGTGGGAQDGSGREGADRASTPASGERTLALDDLVYINRMTTVGHVLPGVAHELNNALQVIGGLVELLGMRGELPPEVQDKVTKIGAQATRSAGMMREFVAFARRDETLPRIDLHKAVEQALSLRRYHLARARIDVVGPQPFSGGVSSIVQADSHAVLQVLLNLIINAEEALAAKPVGERELRIALELEAETILCEVRDNGPGFGDGSRAAAAPFFSTKTKGAAGLGLTVAHALLESDRGSLTIVEGASSCVQVRWRRAH
jgi:C4-dicarboxylate-specific signal transduction histidine kinase